MATSPLHTGLAMPASSSLSDDVIADHEDLHLDSLFIHDFLRGGPPRAEALSHPVGGSHYDLDRWTHHYYNEDGSYDVGPPAWALLCGNLAVVCSSLVTLAVIPTILKIRRTGTVGTLPLLPFSIMIAKAVAWVIYGWMKSEPKLWAPNLFALPFAMFCFQEYALRSPSESPHLPGKLSYHVSLVLAIVSVIILAAILLPARISVNVVGTLAVAVNVVRDWSPLVALPEVIRKKSAESIPAVLSVACCIDNALWIVYGKLVMDDALVYAPNTFRFCLTSAQVLLVVCYGKGKRVEMEMPKELERSHSDVTDLTSLLGEDYDYDDEHSTMDDDSSLTVGNNYSPPPSTPLPETRKPDLKSRFQSGLLRKGSVQSV